MQAEKIHFQSNSFASKIILFIFSGISRLVHNSIMVPVIMLSLVQAAFLLLNLIMLFALLTNSQIDAISGPMQISENTSFQLSLNDEDDADMIIKYYGFLLIAYSALAFVIEKVFNKKIKISIRKAVLASGIIHLINAVGLLVTAGWEALFIQLFFTAIFFIFLFFGLITMSVSRALNQAANGAKPY